MVVVWTAVCIFQSQAEAMEVDEPASKVVDHEGTADTPSRNTPSSQPDQQTKRPRGRPPKKVCTFARCWKCAFSKVDNLDSECCAVCERFIHTGTRFLTSVNKYCRWNEISCSNGNASQQYSKWVVSDPSDSRERIHSCCGQSCWVRRFYEVFLWSLGLFKQVAWLADVYEVRDDQLLWILP